MTSINFQFFIENDSNPFILFSNTGKIKYLNNSAEVLMGSCRPKEIFDLALTHAPQTFGFKKSILNLNFNSFQFYGINILYENDNYIGIHLYNKAIDKVEKEMVLDGFSSTDVNMLLQANMELFNMNYEGKIRLLTDYDIPEFQMHQNNFSLLLRTLFSQFDSSKHLDINMKIKLGEQVMIKEKKYSIIVLELKSDTRKSEADKELKKMANKNCIDIQFKKGSITLEVPAISS
ncbi:MAG: Unknown protein [uncultured Sulfurovum sp.]|uniref:PAS domain-containing protein n=1 Tax=uncultured Sulfurovum sp. TaxID=269237 RepID=A0A6S6THS4_9BACT|nr:MAG: Unknown protein [uncultured Sulfurovum sp.]